MNTLLAGCVPLAFVALLAAQAPVLTHGPFRGHVDTTSMHVWARASEAGEYSLQLTNVVDATTATATAAAAPEHDHVLHFVVNGLTAATAFTVRINQGEHVLFTGGPWTTAIPDDANTATIAFGSCANDKLFPEQPIWARILARSPQALVLLGDTPYIDLGTVAARRQRHREFFALPPIAAALRTIPTWTTWDDHDYAANDEFGAVKGSETARPVFVDWHAHAGYGDGQRGIYTRFRQGPIEVFLLDTRSFADGEPSLLAPGQRTLLGKAQIEWLQRGLLASTAPFKVLACGMVWNAGVRPNKRDCWGNWQPERDALFRWLGAQGIDGVVLLSGDVHRSRVIVHPTRDLAGYDLPEFVTSPLAQNVIEANQVDVPGLVFDAGEPSSCLLLTATVGGSGGAGTLRAVFQAGDGREFHVREFAGDALQRPNAAAAYRRCVAALRAAFGERLERFPELAHDGEVFDPAPALAGTPTWRNAVRAAQPAFDVWHAAVAEPRCRFRPTSGEPLMSEYMQDLLLGLQRLQTLAATQCLQAIADRDAATALATAAALLATARHLQQEPGGIAWAVAAGIERQIVALHGEVATALGADAAARLRASVRDHLAKRGDLAAAGAAVRTETLRLFDGAIATMQRGGDQKAQLARTALAEVRRHFTARVDPLFAVSDAVTGATVAQAVAELARLGTELAAQREQRLLALQALDGKGVAGGEATADLGLLLAATLVPDLAGFLAEQAAVLAELRRLVE